MRKLVLGVSAGALVATAAWAADQPTQETQVAALNRTWAAFARLDADQDGRISALEAANDPLVAAAFTDADLDRDGYLSKEEFANLMKSLDSSLRARAQARMAIPSGTRR
jgi:Ca2+-binding EF-hand superfamily protein